MSEDALKLARQVLDPDHYPRACEWPIGFVWCGPTVSVDAYAAEDGGRVPMTAAELEQLRMWREGLAYDHHELARAVIAQAEEIERLHAALTEALDALETGCDRQWDTCVAPMSSSRIAELRKLVTP